MKNIKGILAGVLALAALMVSCVAEQDTTPEVDITTVRCTIPRIDVEEDFATGILDTLTATKATFSNGNFLWSAGDKIGIVPNTGAQIYFEVDNGAGTSTASFDGGDWAMKSTGTFYAYYPLYPDIFLSKDHVSVSYTGQTQSGNNNNLHTGDYWTLYTEGTTAVGNALNFSFNHLTSFFKTYVTVPAGTYTKITFSAPTDVFIKDGYFDLSAQTPTIVGTTMTDVLSLDLQNVTFADETELTGYLVLAPVDITGIPITVTVYKDGEPAYEYTLTKASPMVAAKTYAFRATALTQLAASATQANALFAAGATAVTITEPLTEDATILLPNTSEAVTLILPTTASTSTLTVSYPPAAESYPTTLSITGPEGADLDIRTPNSTVTVNGIAYDQVTSRTAANTCIIPVGVTVNNLKVVQGGVQVYGTVSRIDLSEQEDDAIINVSGTVTSLLGEDDEEYAPVTGVTLNQSSINLNVGATETLTATVTPVGAYPKVTWTSSDETVATVSASGVVSAIAAGSATITATTICDGFSATCVVTICAPTTNCEYEYVDLGLPSGIKWATFNLGATSPEELGDYYQWAGTRDVTSTSIYVSLDNCPYHTGYSSSTKWRKYIPTGKSSYWSGIGEPDNLLVLDESDDAAQIIIGGKWRMPTVGEYLDLMDKCTITWTSDYNGTGIRGLVFTSKMAGYTDRSIFFPAAGYRTGSSTSSSSTEGHYWTSTLNEGDPCKAAHFKFSSSSQNCVIFDRYYGNTIRAVYDEDYHVHSLVFVPGQNPTETVPGWKACYKCSTCGKYFDEDHKPIGDETAYLAWRSKGGAGYLELPHAIDLGLSIKWASCNLGAENAYSIGDYYAWGETEPKTSYTYSTYKYGWTPNFTKYCSILGYGTVDNKVILELEDDAAHVNWGGNWRMPTDKEIQEINNTNNCSWTKYNAGNSEFNGVEGYKVQSLKPGYTDNYIFIPCSGIKTESLSSSSAYYWSSSLTGSAESPYAGGAQATYGYNRCSGLQIRAVYAEDPACGITGISLNKSSTTLYVNDTEKLTATVQKNTNAVNTTVEWYSSNPSVVTVDYRGNISTVATGVATITAKTHFGGFTATCNVTVTAAPEPEYVDLGLSVKWATFNLGASRPSGYGKYYAWGETKAYGEDDPSNANNYSYSSSYTKYDYSWRTYKWYDYPNSKITKYCTNSVTGIVDNKIILEKEDDAAYVNWGGNWRMPTSAEFSELKNSDNCTWTWYDGTGTEFDGARGYKIQSLKPGYTDRYIFLPVSRVHRNNTNTSSGCGYWTSSLYQYNWGANVSRHNAGNTIDWGYLEDNDNSYGRYNGYNIRPVYSEDPAGGVTGVSLDKSTMTMSLGEISTLYATVLTKAGSVNNYRVWISSDTSVAKIEGYYNGYCKVTALSVGTATITVRTAMGGFEATCTINVEAPPEVDAESVDLGLPSGTLWAAYNIGATTPEESGGFFAWGETTARNSFYGWSDYKHSNGSSSSITKYSGSGTVLQSIDDAAYLNWGSNWRMPTYADWNELLSNCTWTWTTQNEVNGYLVTSNSNSNSIFLPAAGYRGSSLSSQGTYGYYWTSTLSYTSTAYYVQFSSGSKAMSTNLYRYYGMPVRAVRNQ